MQLFFTPQARTDLLDVLDRYQNNRKKGRQIRANLINSAALLKENPRLGRIFEELTKIRETEYRFLVVGGYKIVYRIDENQQMIYILRFFDTRQDPKRLLQ